MHFQFWLPELVADADRGLVGLGRDAVDGQMPARQLDLGNLAPVLLVDRHAEVEGFSQLDSLRDPLVLERRFRLRGPADRIEALVTLVVVQVCRAKVRCSNRWKSCPGKGRPGRVAIPAAMEATKWSKPGRQKAA